MRKQSPSSEQFQPTERSKQRLDVSRSGVDEIELLRRCLGTLILVFSAVLATENFHRERPVLVEWIIYSLVLLWYMAVSFRHPEGSGNGRKTRMVVVAILLAIGLSVVQILRAHEHRARVERPRPLARKFATLRWIAYEPIEFDPYIGCHGTEAKIRHELTVLHQSGFNGLITFDSDGLCSKIPQWAKEAGFEGVIMGLKEVGDGKEACAELSGALRARRYVDGYCVGHMFTRGGCSPEDVLGCMRLLSKQTKKPVSTTLRPSGYETYPRIARAVDWFFPDVHADWYVEADAQRVLDQTKRLIERMDEFRRNEYPQKPILLKMVSFPSAGVGGASEDEQNRFHRLMRGYVEGSPDYPEPTYVSYFSAFDIAWKTQKRGWQPGETNVGLFHRDLTPKKAVPICSGKSDVSDIGIP